MTGPLFLGIDVGTGSARAGLFDDTGRMLASAKHDICMWREAGSIVEQSSDDIWQAVCASVRGALAKAEVAPSAVAGIGFDATCSLVVLGPGGQPVSVSFSTKENPQDFGVNIRLDGDWQPAKLSQVPAQIASQLSGHLPWQGKVDITLPHQGGARYEVELKGDAKEVSSRLPAPLNKAGGEAMPIAVSASGDPVYGSLLATQGAEGISSMPLPPAPQGPRAVPVDLRY